MVTHHQVDDAGIAQALEVIRAVVTSKIEGGQRVVA
jgi:hypothetical protein